MVPMQLLPLEDQVGYHAEDNQGDDFLYDFQLHQREWTTNSMPAIIHEKAITAIRGQFVEMPAWLSFRCPYHASVIKTLLQMSNKIV